MWALRYKDRRYTLTKSSVSIGQGRECDVVIQVSARVCFRSLTRKRPLVIRQEKELLMRMYRLPLAHSRGRTCEML